MRAAPKYPFLFRKLYMNRKTRAAMVSVCSNISLIIMKMVAGFASGSVSIISEAIHSAMDLVAALIALVRGEKVRSPAR